MCSKINSNSKVTRPPLSEVKRIYKGPLEGIIVLDIDGERFVEVNFEEFDVNAIRDLNISIENVLPSSTSSLDLDSPFNYAIDDKNLLWFENMIAYADIQGYDKTITRGLITLLETYGNRIDEEGLDEVRSSKTFSRFEEVLLDRCDIFEGDDWGSNPIAYLLSETSFDPYEGRGLNCPQLAEEWIKRKNASYADVTLPDGHALSKEGVEFVTTKVLPEWDKNACEEGLNAIEVILDTTDKRHMKALEKSIKKRLAELDPSIDL